MFGSNPVKMRFIQDYGKLSVPFSCVSSTGSPSLKVNLHLVLFFICLIGAIILFVLSNPKKNLDKLDENGKPIKIPRTKTQQTLFVISIIVLAISFLNIGYYGFLYFSCFNPQFRQWFTKLGDTSNGITRYNEYRYNQALLDEISNLNFNRRNRSRRSRDYVRLF